jgi:hypothetical protein
LVSWQAADDEFIGVVDHFSKLGVFDGAVQLDGVPVALVLVVAGRTASCVARNSSAKSGSHLRFTLPGSPRSETSANILPATLNTATSSQNG